MAKKNIVLLMGFINEILNKEGTLFTLQIRKNDNKFVFPIIELTDDTYGIKDDIEVGNLISIVGKVKTTQKELKYPCPNCSEHITNKYIFTTITADKAFLLSSSTNEPFINKVVLLGTVCKEKEFKYIKGTRSPVGNTKYQMGVNRREPDKSDYPWITTFAKQAEEDAKRLNVGSQILVDGTINTRINQKDCTCAYCGESITIQEPHTEILGITVEYLNNCLFEKNEQ